MIAITRIRGGGGCKITFSSSFFLSCKLAAEISRVNGRCRFSPEDLLALGFKSFTIDSISSFFHAFPPNDRIFRDQTNRTVSFDHLENRVFRRGKERIGQEAGSGSLWILSNDHVRDNQPASVLVSRIHACLRIHSRRS